MQRIRLTADYRVLGERVATDRPTAFGNIPREAHWDGREQTQSFFDDTVEEGEVVEVGAWLTDEFGMESLLVFLGGREG